jgi:hypothetical protein
MFDLAAERIHWQDFQDPSLRQVAARLWALGQAHRLSLEDLLADEALMGLGGLLTDLSAAGEKRGKYDATFQGAVTHMLYLRDMRESAARPTEGYDDERLRRIDEEHRRKAATASEDIKKQRFEDHAPESRRQPKIT